MIPKVLPSYVGIKALFSIDDFEKVILLCFQPLFQILEVNSEG